MELVAIVFMLGAGGAIAIFAMTAMAIARRETEGQAPVVPDRRDALASSILVQIVHAGGTAFDEAVRAVRRGTGYAAPVTGGIDIGNWAESFAQQSTATQRHALLESAVQLVAAQGKPVPLRQYAGLLDLSFGLGFQTDALARLRQTYGFEYVDHAKERRPGDAAQTSRQPLFQRSAAERAELLAILGITGEPSRRDLTAAYRRVVALHHPDRHHGGDPEERDAAAERFISVTRAYEELLLHCRD